MFGIGMPEMILILALALIVVGPDKLPELARSIAKGVLELKKTVSTLKDEFASENPLDSIKPELEEVTSSLKDELGETATDGWENMIVNADTPAETKGAEERLPTGADEAGTDQTGDEIIEMDPADDSGTKTESIEEPGQHEEARADIDAVSGEQEEKEQPPIAGNRDT